MKHLNLPKTNHGYSMINGRLIECDIKQIKYHLEENMGTDCDAAFTYVVAHADWTENISPDNFYESIGDFKSNKHVIRDRQLWLNNYFNSVNFSNDGTKTYVIDNGMVKKVDVTINDITFNFGDENKLLSAESPDIPANGWKDEQLAMDHLDVEVVNADGSMQKICGAATLIKLSDEQMALVNEICALTKKAHDMGVRFYNNWNGCYVFNVSNLDKYRLTYSNDEGFSEAVDALSSEFYVGDMRIFGCSEDDTLFFNRK